LCGIELGHEEFKKITFGHEKPINPYQKSVKYFADSYSYILNNLSSVFDEKLIKTTYYILSAQELKSELCFKILETYYKTREMEIVSRVVHLVKVVDSLDAIKKVQFSMILVNYLLVKEKYQTLIIYKNDHEEFLSLDFSNIKETYTFFFQLIRKSSMLKKDGFTHITREEVMKKLKPLRRMLRKEYRVKDMFVYGSVMKELRNKNSDIDLLISFSSELILIEKSIYLERLKGFMEHVINQKVDLIEFDDALINLETLEMENTLRII